MGLIVALDDNNEAAGELFWDDGESTGEASGARVSQGECRVLPSGRISPPARSASNGFRWSAQCSAGEPSGGAEAGGGSGRWEMLPKGPGDVSPRAGAIRNRNVGSEWVSEGGGTAQGRWRRGTRSSVGTPGLDSPSRQESAAPEPAVQDDAEKQERAPRRLGGGSAAAGRVGWAPRSRGRWSLPSE